MRDHDGRKRFVEDRPATEASSMPTEDLFVYVCVLIDDLITAGGIAIP